MTLYNLKRRRVTQTKPSYPSTAELFLFVRRVLADRRGERDPERLMDADVGRLLYERTQVDEEGNEVRFVDYKYTHQWRFGKKRMFDVSELEELAQKAEIDLDLIQKVASGIWTADQAFDVYRKRKQGAYKHVRRTIRLDGVELEIEAELLEDRIPEFEAAVARLEEKLARRLGDPDALITERNEEIQLFERFVHDLELPRVSFYRKNKA